MSLFTTRNQNEEQELPINMNDQKIIWKYSEKSCNPIAVVTMNCVIQCDIKADFPKSGHICACTSTESHKVSCILAATFR